MSANQYTPTDQLPAYGTSDDMDPHGAVVIRREPPGEAFPPVYPVSGQVNPTRPPRPSELLMTLTSYVALLAQRTAPVNEQAFEGAGTSVASLVDIDLGLVKPQLVTRLHRLIVVGTPSDDFTISLHSDSPTPASNVLYAMRFGPAGAPAVYTTLDGDGIGVAEINDLHIPAGRRLVARCRPATAVGPVYVRLSCRSYPA